MLATSLLVAALAGLAAAAPCTGGDVGVDAGKISLPKTGGAKELPEPAAGLSIKAITVGHGIQNYTCDTPTSNATAKGAIAILYDARPMAPKPEGDGQVSDNVFLQLSSNVFGFARMPLNMADPAATAANLTSLPAGAVVGQPYLPDDNDLKLGGMTLPFIGRHYFDAAGSPTFDLVRTSGLYASVAKSDNVPAPAKGPGPAVDWLLLKDNGKGLSQGVQAVYRVVTVAGTPQPCSEKVLGTQSTGYTALYYFLG